MHINASDSQLLLVDLQPVMISSAATVQPAALAQAAGALAQIAQLLEIPVTFATVPERGAPGHLLPELIPFVATNNVFSRTMIDPFDDSSLVEVLAAKRRRTLIVGGYSAEVAVLQTALTASRSGYKVIVPVDVISSRHARTEAAVIRYLEREGVLTTSVRSLALMLAPRVLESPGLEVLTILGSL